MSSNVPARVAADSAQADQQLAALAEQLAKASSGTTPPTDPAPAAAPEGGPAPASAPAAPAAASPPPAAPAPAPSVTPVNDELLRRMHAQLDSATGRVEQLAAANARLEAELQQARSAPAAPTPAPAPAARQVTDTDLQEFGEDTIGMVRRVVSDETQQLRAQVDALRAQLAAIEGRVQRTAETAETIAERNQQTEHGRYLERLAAAVPDWATINQDPKFEEWLAAKDQFSGRRKHDLLIEAHQALDAGRVVAIFTAYKQGLEGGAPAAPASPSPSPAVDPASQVAPSTTSAAPAPASGSDGKIYTQKEFDDMHDAMLKKRISKAEFEAFEREYYLAVAEGRVRV